MAQEAVVGLLQVQAAAQAWAVLAGRVLGGRGALDADRAAVAAALEAERAFVSEAFQLPIDGGDDDDDDDDEQLPPQSSSSSHHHNHQGQQQELPPSPPLSRSTRVRRQLRAMGRRAALGRARAESLLARLFLQQCAVTEALRRLDAPVDGEEEGGVDGIVAGLLVVGGAVVEEEEDLALEGLLRALGVDMREEAAALKAALRGGLEEEETEEGEERWGALLPSLLDVGSEVEDGGLEVHEPLAAESAAVVFDSSGGGGDSGSPTTSLEAVEDDDVLEVFEGTAVAAATAVVAGRRRRGLELEQQEQQQQQQQQQQGALLLGELGRVLEGRERQRQGAVVVKVRVGMVVVRLSDPIDRSIDVLDVVNVYRSVDRSISIAHRSC
jgi:hypothetical protein